MEHVWENIYIGTVTGVSSGLILALFFGARTYFANRSTRREQIRHLTRLIESSEARIFGVTESVDIPQLNRELSQEEIRKGYFDDLVRQLDAALLGRCSNLTFDEIEEVKSIFIRLHKLYPKFVPNEGWYSDTFQKARTAKWLKLAPVAQVRGKG